MFLDAWSLALSLAGLVVLFLLTLAARTGVRVLRFWDPASDDQRQIRLESEIWLSSTLVAYALGIQILLLALFVQAADEFAGVIAGAMCATGSLLSNDFGMPTLLVKLAGVFCYGFWLVLHHLDIQSESYPLVRAKFVYLLALLPLLATDLSLQTLYLANLSPDIITSCCAVVFSAGAGGDGNLLAGWSQSASLGLFYATAAILAALAGWLLKGRRQPRPGGELCYSLIWLWFLGLALTVITTVVSSYIYAMPFHRCPFCILKPEYGYIGFAIYGSLLLAAFYGLTVWPVGRLASREGLAGVVVAYQRRAIKCSLLFLLLFVALASFHWLRYLLLGGE